jgi:hypothetical protein
MSVMRQIILLAVLVAGTFAFVVALPHSTQPAHVQPYSYSVTYHGLHCTMDVNSAGNGSLNNCER